MSTTTIKKLNYSLEGQSVNYLRNFLLDAIANDPTVAEALQLKLNMTDNRLKLHDGREVRTLAYVSDLDPYVRYRGGHDASTGVPTAASSVVLPGEPIQAGDKWLITTAGTIADLGGESDNLSVGDFITAIVDDASNPEDFVAINANIDTGDVVVIENAVLTTLPADTPTDIMSTKLDAVDIASVRDANGEDLTSSVVLIYGENKITVSSSLELNNLVIKMIGKPGTVTVILWTEQTPEVLDLTATDPDFKGFNGGFASGGYAYFIPRNNGSPHGNLVRLSDSTVESLDLTLTDPELKGFRGGFVEGNYGYLVPLNNGSPFGKVAKVDLTDFSTVEVLDLTLTDPELKGFTGGFSDGTYGYFVPSNNGSPFGKLARVLLSDFSTVEVLDLTLTDSELVQFHGGIAVNGYAYLSPEGLGKVPQINLTDFSTVEVLDLTLLNPNLIGFPGIFTDGSYAYLVPHYNSTLGHHGNLVKIDLTDFSTVETLDLTLTDPELKGFVGGFYNNGWAYCSPHGGFGGQFMGKLARVSTADFSTVEVLDLAATAPALAGFDGAFTDGTNGYFVPFYNGAYAGVVAKITV